MTLRERLDKLEWSPTDDVRTIMAIGARAALEAALELRTLVRNQLGRHAFVELNIVTDENIRALLAELDPQHQGKAGR